MRVGAIYVLVVLLLRSNSAWKSIRIVKSLKFKTCSNKRISNFQDSQSAIRLIDTKNSFDLSEQILLSNETKKQEKLKSSRDSWIARGILLSVSAFYGTNFGCVKILGEALEPSVAATLRFSLAALVFSPYLFDAIKSNFKLIQGGIEVGIYAAIGYYAQAISLQTSHASTAAFICSLAVIVVPILDSLFAPKKSSDAVLSSLLPAALAAAGVAALELGGSELPGIGDLWAFLQPLFFGLGFWRTERIVKLCKQPGDAQAFTGSMLVVVAVMSIGWMSHDFLFPLLSSGGNAKLVAAISEQIVAIRDWHILAALFWTGVVTTALTIYGENIAMRSLSAAESTVIYSTEPLWGAAFAATFLGETLGWNTFLGAALILTACAWSSLGPNLASVGVLTTTLEASSQVERLEEVSENISLNWMNLFTSLQDKTSEVP